MPAGLKPCRGCAWLKRKLLTCGAAQDPARIRVSMCLCCILRVSNLTRGLKRRMDGKQSPMLVHGSVTVHSQLPKVAASMATGFWMRQAPEMSFQSVLHRLGVCIRSVNLKGT